MDEPNELIYQWLSTVLPQGQNYPKAGMPLRPRLRHKGTSHIDLIPADIQNPGTEKAVPADVPYMQEEESEGLKEPTHAASKATISGKCDKTDTSPTLAMMPQIEPSNAYERRPRHRTREDRYDYKPNASTIGSRSRPLKPKGKRNRARRHTMNDEFHAINVTESRLTLRNLNWGIFNKGKTSSPTTCAPKCSSTSHTKDGLNKNHHKEKVKSDLPSSEMMFLSNSTEKKISGPDSKLTPTRNEPIHTIEHRKHRLPLLFDTQRPCVNIAAATVQRKGSCSPQSPSQCLQRTLDHPQKAKSLDPNQHCNRTRSKRPCSPIDLDPISHEPSTNHPLGDMRQQEACSSLPPKRCRSTAVRSPRKKRKISMQTSSMSYTWSEGDNSDAELDNSLGQRLLTMVHFRLDLQGVAGEHPDLGCPGNYWTLSELWELLRERKTLWSNGVEDKEQACTVVNSRQQASPSFQLDTPHFIERDYPVRETGRTQNEAVDEHNILQVTAEVNCETRSNISQHRSTTSKRQNLTRGFPLRQDFTADNEDSCSTDDLEEKCFVPLPYDVANDSGFPLAPRTEGTSPHLHDIDLHNINRVEDDDLFYKTLDAAYDAIFVSNTAAEAASNLQESLRFPQVDDPSECSEPPEAITHSGCHQALSQIRTEVLTHRARASEGVEKEEMNTRPRATSPPREITTSYDYTSHGPNIEMPCLIEGHHRSTTDQNGTCPSAGFLGFGRKNKLY